LFAIARMLDGQPRIGERLGDGRRQGALVLHQQNARPAHRVH
jgi:hypothetical protein